MDNRQYRQIVDDYADMVYRIALNQTRRVPDAEDVVQAVFLKLYEKPPTWLGNGLERDGGRGMAGRGRTRRVPRPTAAPPAMSVCARGSFASR